MRTIKYTDPETFEDVEFTLNNFHYSLTEYIRMRLYEDFPNKITEILPNKDREDLSISFIRDRLNGESISEKYRITVSKILE
jgi:hypothetical protein